MMYPVRRLVVENLIILDAFTFAIIPGLSSLMLPVLGVFAINDFLDYKGWEQVGNTLMIPILLFGLFDFNSEG